MSKLNATGYGGTRSDVPFEAPMVTATRGNPTMPEAAEGVRGDIIHPLLCILCLGTRLRGKRGNPPTYSRGCVTFSVAASPLT